MKAFETFPEAVRWFLQAEGLEVQTAADVEGEYRMYRCTFLIAGKKYGFLARTSDLPPDQDEFEQTFMDGINDAIGAAHEATQR